MVDKNLQLVRAIEKYPCLYNHTNSADYSKKDLSDKAWTEIANETQMSISECKEKWKNLRYGLLRSLRLNPDGTLKKKYYLHDEMEFVIPFMKTVKYQEVPLQPLDEEEEVSFSIDYENSSSHHDIEITEPLKKRLRLPDRNRVYLPRVEHDESRRNFLLSLQPEVNELSEPQMRIFRRKVLALLDEISVEGNDYDRLVINLNRDSIKHEPL